jgi:hypothetical protein
VLDGEGLFECRGSCPVNASSRAFQILGDQATKEDLLESLEATLREARELHAKGKALIDELLHTGGPFPHRLHLVEPVATFVAEFYRDLIEWSQQTMTEIEEWPDTRDIGLTPRGRERSGYSPSPIPRPSVWDCEAGRPMGHPASPSRG